jgi:hypothetical protein
MTYGFWKGPQLALLRQCRDKGVPWVTDQCNAIPGAPQRTRDSVQRKARSLGHLDRTERITTTPGIDAAIRQAYASGKYGAAARCAAACNRPRWWVVLRAKQLNLRQLKTKIGRPFTDREIATIREHAHMPVGEIQARLKRGGSTRSRASILDFIKRNAIANDRDRPLSGVQVAELFGIDPKGLYRSIRTGKLIAKKSGEGGIVDPHAYLIEPVEIARFIIKHPQMIDLRKVDPIWFIDLLAHYSAAASHDMHRNKGVRVAQMVRENPDITGEDLADMMGVSISDGQALICDGRRALREAA